MFLEHLSITNYRNLPAAELSFSPKINCLIGPNGAGKTNVLDAIYFLSFCHSAVTVQDSLVVRHGHELLVLEGDYSAEPLPLKVFCGMKVGTKKHFRCNNKEYKRLSEHIGLIPIVMVSPSDTFLIDGGSEERRRFMDQVVAQQDRTYIDSLNRYNKALQQRNALLRDEQHEPDADLMALLEEEMARHGETVSRKRAAVVDTVTPLFQHLYATVSGGRETVSLEYVSHCQRGPLLEVIRRDRQKDRAVGYSLHGIHRDDISILLDGHPMRREGSQGQMKTFVIALKLAQYELLSTAGKPLLLLDDIFDKLDATRVEQIIRLVASPRFGQIFITDTNRDHLDQILSHGDFDYRLFTVSDGEVTAGSHS